MDIDNDIDSNQKITDLPLVAFTPSNTREAFSSRWDTKSSNRVLEVLKKLENMGKIKFVFLTNVHLDEVIALKKKANIVIDDLSTGALHLSALEGVMLGKATITFLDNATLSALSEGLGTAEFPFINITFENLEEVLLKLCNDYSFIEQIGSYSKEWGKNYYSPENIVKKFVAIYQNKSTNGKIKIKQTSERLDSKEIYSKVRNFLQIEIPDIIYWQRAKMDKLISSIKTFTF